jgi:uncharacterized peroxidase-related enzyme
VVQAVLEGDWRAAPVPEKLRAMLVFVEKLTLTPHEVGPADMAPLRAAGLTDEAIEDAIHICGAFNTINRIADTLGFDLQTQKGYASAARFLLKVGYI